MGLTEAASLAEAPRQPPFKQSEAARRESQLNKLRGSEGQSKLILVMRPTRGWKLETAPHTAKLAPMLIGWEGEGVRNYKTDEGWREDETTQGENGMTMTMTMISRSVSSLYTKRRLGPEGPWPPPCLAKKRS